MNPLALLGNILIGNLAKSLTDNLFYKTNGPVRGSILYCDLAFGAAEHSGIYIGNNQVVHKNGQGLVEPVSVNQFKNTISAITIYISCDSNGEPVGHEHIANNAEKMIGHFSTYSLLNNNCHQFCSYCITGDLTSTTFALRQLKKDAKLFLDSSQWRTWDLTKR
ncbi:MAG: lecithin retinol acyltransferase family protein [Marinomonas sp.]